MNPRAVSQTPSAQGLQTSDPVPALPAPGCSRHSTNICQTGRKGATSWNFPSQLPPFPGLSPVSAVHPFPNTAQELGGPWTQALRVGPQFTQRGTGDGCVCVCPRTEVTQPAECPGETPSLGRAGRVGLGCPGPQAAGGRGRGGGSGGRPRRCSCPFTVSASEAALTRTSAIRLPPGLGPEAGGGGAGAAGGGWGGERRN